MNREKQKENDLYWLSVCDKIAEKSKCQKRHVGSVIIDEIGRMVSAGYNGHPMKTDLDHICLRKNIKSGTNNDIGLCVHGEVSAMLFCNFDSFQEATLYINFPPCKVCVRYILQMIKIKNLVYYNSGGRDDGIELLKKMIASNPSRLEIRAYDRSIKDNNNE